MKSVFYILLSIIFLSGCSREKWCNCLESTGDEITETRSLEPFHTLVMDNNVDVIIHQGNYFEAKITCGKNLVDGIKTDVENGRLTIKNINRCNWIRDFKNKFLVEITTDGLEQITNYGSGNLSCPDTLTADKIQVESWNGTGTLQLLLSCNEAHLKLHTGPADIIASGISNSVFIYSAGNGFCNASNLPCNYAAVTSRSTGDCEINSSGQLDATLEYNGDIIYYGNPTEVNSTITGSGKLIKR